MRCVLLAVGLAAGLVVVTRPALAAVPSCPTIEGWGGLAYPEMSGEGPDGGSTICTYLQGPGHPPSARAFIAAEWVSQSNTDPASRMPDAGCGRAVAMPLGYRTMSSPERWAFVRYSIDVSSDQNVDEAMLISEEARLVAAATALLAEIGSSAKSCTAPTIDAETNRIPGVDRYDTAAMHAGWFSTAAVVYVATGATYPDALGAGPAAAIANGPILLVTRDSIPATTAAALTRLQPAQIVAVGGSSAISGGVLAALGSYAAEVVRISGTTRYETAAALVAHAFPEPVSTVYVASGRSFADPIIAGARAAFGGAPLLLVDGTGPLESVIAEQLGRLAPSEIVAVGPEADLGGVLGALDSYGTVRRVAHADVFDRSAAVWDDIAPPLDVILARYDAFPDALAGAAIAGYGSWLDGSGAFALMLSRTECIPSAVVNQLARLQTAWVRLLGGTGALSEGVERFQVC